MLETSIQIKTDHFDGPLALLLSLIQKEEMDIQDLDLIKIIQQYLNYLFQVNELNFDVAGDYLYFAATLILLKSKNAIADKDFLNIEKELNQEHSLQITSEADLIYRLEQLQHFQSMGQKLWKLPRKGKHVFVKPKVNRKAIIDSILTPVELQSLINKMMDLITQEKKSYTVLKKENSSMKDKISFLKEYMHLNRETDFEELLKKNGAPNSSNTILTFISLLELTRLRYIDIIQPKIFGNIFISVFKSLKNLNLDQTTGFDQILPSYMGEEHTNG